jgi:hypothetical protein
VYILLCIVLALASIVHVATVFVICALYVWLRHQVCVCVNPTAWDDVCLLYIASVPQPDLMYAASEFAQYIAKPLVGDMKLFACHRVAGGTWYMYTALHNMRILLYNLHCITLALASAAC